MHIQCSSIHYTLYMYIYLFSFLSVPRYELNTCIEPPHGEKVTSLAFQPPHPNRRKSCKPSSESPSSLPTPVSLCVSTSEDGKFKSWVLVDGEGEGEGEGGGEVEGEERKREASWACRSVGYYHSLSCRGACFSQDGSLLAVNFQKVSSFSIAMIIHCTLAMSSIYTPYFRTQLFTTSV